MISFCTANLIAVSAVENIVYPIVNGRGLSERTVNQVCVCSQNGLTRTFFEDQQIETGGRIYKLVQIHHIYVQTNNENFKQSDFTFIVEPTSIEYVTENIMLHAIKDR